jgi:hypothetical protein
VDGGTVVVNYLESIKDLGCGRLGSQDAAALGRIRAPKNQS